MATRKIDKRTIATRAALLSAFRELVLTKGYEAVAIGDVAQRAGVGRTTLYLHFANKQSLLKASLEALCATLAECASPERLTPWLEHFQQQRQINGAFFADPIKKIWVRHLAGKVEARLRKTILPRSLTALTIAEMQIGLITNWLSGAGGVTPARVAEALVTQTRALINS